MPPNPVNSIQVIAEFGGDSVWDFNEKTKEIFCKLCIANCPINRRTAIQQHVGTKKHKRHLEMMQSGEKMQKQQMITASNFGRNNSEFAKDLSRMMVECNIPFAKVENPAFVSFLEKYAKKTVPSRWSLTKQMEEQANSCLQIVREK